MLGLDKHELSAISELWNGSVHVSTTAPQNVVDRDGLLNVFEVGGIAD